MWPKLSTALLSATLFLSFISPQTAEAKSVEDDIKSSGTLKVGLREDSPLFGFGKEKLGYCKDFAENVAKKLSQEYGKEIKTEFVKSTTQNRWVLVTDGAVHFECGPNSINPSQTQKYDITFSAPFFVTATQIFTKAGINENTLRKGTIGTIAGTTNAQQMDLIYPLGQVDDSFKRRSHGIADVQTGAIDGFASDGILLVGTASLMNIPLKSFNLVTPVVEDKPFCAAYAMILPGDEENQPWRSKINDMIIKSDNTDAIWQNWFSSLTPYFQTLSELCK